MTRRQPTKHIAYYELLEAVRNSDGCPLCKVEATNTERYFESLLHENVNDPGVREDLVRSRGYCHRHAHYLLTRGNALGTAILYQDQVRLSLRLLDSFETVPPAIALKGTRARKSQSRPCPACRAQTECRKRYASTLIEWIHDHELTSALQAGHGFCIPHFLELLDMPMSARTRAFLIRLQREKMTSLLRELEEFHRKCDYRFRDEGFGSESDSWLRAVRMMVGEKDMF